MNIVNFRASPQHRRSEDMGLLEKIFFTLISLVILTGLLNAVLKAFLNFWKGNIIQGLSHILPLLLVFFLLVGLLGAFRGGERP